MSRQIVDDWLDGKISTDVAIFEGMKSDDPEVRVWALQMETEVLKMKVTPASEYVRRTSGDVT